MAVTKELNSPGKFSIVRIMPADLAKAMASLNPAIQLLRAASRSWLSLPGVGIIVTGAPVENLPFEAVDYWDDLRAIFDWAEGSVGRAYYICWAAQAALKHFHGLEKRSLAAKRFGVFRHRVRQPHSPLFRGFGETFDIPVSRHTEVRRRDLEPGRGLVVLADTDCMVDIARYFLEFTQNQSCGKCTFCRVGTRRMLDILERLCGGQGRKGDIEELDRLAHMIKAGSLCGLGKTAPNPVLTTLRYFRDEYEAHIEGRCPAGRCKALITYSVTDDCIGCTLCAQHCPADAISMTPYEKHEINPEACIRCGSCMNICPANAVTVQ